MNNEQASEALIRISEPIQHICEDDDLVILLEEVQKHDPKTPFVKAIGKFLPKVVLYALKKHRADLYEVIGALSMQPTAKVGEMNFTETVRLVRDSYDDILRDFFTSSGPAAKTSES